MQHPRIMILTFLLFFATVLIAQASTNTGRQGCEIKKRRIEMEINYARENHNIYKLERLEAARKRIEYVCSRHYQTNRDNLEHSEK
ncbi:DUF1090 family protein [Pseudocitrobacter faecalis]|uniref:DUF1090 family protein n=1 Tax=Pseudocitrobacter faecalis TaxID=1398493 RepID=UPI003B9E8065